MRKTIEWCMEHDDHVMLSEDDGSCEIEEYDLVPVGSLADDPQASLIHLRAEWHRQSLHDIENMTPREVRRSLRAFWQNALAAEEGTDT